MGDVSQRYVARPLTGGLDTKTPQTAVGPSASPDLSNVFLHRHAVEKRPGFTPLIREHPKLNAIENVGHHGNAATASGNRDFLIVPGHMLAGHRVIYETLSAITIECIIEIGDLTEEHGGNANPGVPPGYGPAPFTLKIRPIISKGPIHRTDDVLTAHSPTDANITWDTTVASEWGDRANEGMPFCIYLFNNVGTWEFRLSFHTFNVNWILQTVTNATTPEVGGRYHLIGTIDEATTTARLRVGTMREGEATSYVDANISFAGETWTEGNRCPIQVFDCPQMFVDANSTGSPTQRPGYFFADPAKPADGAYWFASKRFEGKIEDIVIYNSDKLSGSTDALDRGTKIDLSVATGVINAWTMDQEGDQIVQEMTGRGNHLYFAPAGPVYDGISGGPRGGASWWFNGNTSYATVDLEETLTTFNANWREFVTGGVTTKAFMNEIVRQNEDHGLEVSFWVDSIEPQMEQVIMEIHAVMRLAIGVDGKLRGYCREGTIVAGPPDPGSYYQGPITSNTTLVPGQRYTVSLMRLSGGLSMNMSVNNGDDVTLAGLAASDSAGVDISGISFGMGGVETTVEEPADSGTPNQINTDSRAGFVGRIEQARIICSNRRITPVYKDASEDDLQYAQAVLWESPMPANRKLIRPEDEFDTVQNVNDGVAAQIGKDFQGRFIRYFVEDSLLSTAQYTLDADVADLGEGGHNDLERVKIRTWYVLSQWVFNVDDGVVNYAGSYIPGVEYRMLLAADLEPNMFRGVHLQQSAVQDDLGALGDITKKCIESDSMTEDYVTGATGMRSRVSTHRLRPYGFRSPRELAVRWARGLMTPLTETNQITLLADWQHQESGERFLMTACGRQIYWMKPIWKRGSPFDAEVDGSALWFGGQVGDHVVAQATQSEQETTGAGTRTTVVWEAWVYPYRLDGTRLLAFKGNPATPAVNYCIALQDGAIELMGTADANTTVWRFQEGEFRADEILRTQSVKVNAWNHVHVTLKNAGPEVRVNGELIPLVDSSADAAPPSADGFTTGTADAANYSLYIGGLPELRNAITYDPGNHNISVTYEAFHGLLTEVRQRNAEDTTNWPAGESGLPPTARYSDDANTYYLFPFNEAEGWGFDNGAAAAAGDDARSEIRELQVIAEGLSESTGHRYDFAVFRDRLYVTNGESRPQQIRFSRWSDPDGPFLTSQIGMLSPFAVQVTITEVTTGFGTAMADGVYQFYMSFINEDLTESEALLLGTVTLSAAPANGDGFHIDNIPRSSDPQVIGRRFYVSADGGGQALINTTLEDNDSADLEFEPTVTGLGLPEVGDRLPAPRARHIAVGQFSLILADLPDEPAGQNAFIVSQSREPTYFNVDNTIVIDSEDGKPVISVRGLFGRTFISKRDSVWQFSLQGIGIIDEIGLGLRLVNKSIGVGGGDSLYDNIIFGAGDKGVHRFDAANVDYTSEELEGDWNSVVDRSDVGLVQMFGAYYWPNSQYWLSTRTKGQIYNERIYVLHTAVGDRQAWTRLLVPKHTYMASRLRGDNQDPQMLLGGLSGQILVLNDEGSGVYIDGTDGSINDDGATTLTGTATAGTTTTLTMAGANFDTTGPGLRGVSVKFTFADGSTEERIIEGNTQTVLTWRTATSQAVAATTTFVIGGYLGYWTPAWLAPQKYGMGLQVNWIDLDLLPEASGTLTIEALTAVGSVAVDRPWDTAATVETATQDMTLGWLAAPIREDMQNRGRYFRVRFSTDGIRSPFAIVGWGFRYKEEGLRGVGVT